MSGEVAKRIKLIIVDEQTLFREGLQMVLNRMDDIEVVGVADNGREVIELLENCHPDLVLMDMEMPVMNGMKSIRLIKERYPHMKILILLAFAQDDYIVEGLANGASSYLLKDSRTEELVANIRQTVRGQFMLPASIAAKLAVRIQRLTRSRSPQSLEKSSDYALLEPLTEREREIAMLMVQGYTNKEIAQRLYMSNGTIRNNISAIYSKLGTSDRVKAINVLRGHLALDR